jgi:large subunit ribosomal protein L27
VLQETIEGHKVVKIFGGQKVEPGNIIVRQKGTKFWPGEGVLLSRDFTIVALKSGLVQFKKRMGKQFVSVA